MKNSEIDVSIIIPAYNEENEISNCINSIINSNHNDIKYEIIVVNDGSTDKTEELTKELAERYHNISVISKKNGGKASAQNVGLKYAHGKFILVTDADVVVERDWIVKMFDNLNIYDVVIGSWYPINTYNWVEKMQNAFCLVLHKFGGAKKIPEVGANFGFRKEILKHVGEFNERKIVVLEDFIKNVLNVGYTIHYNPEIKVFTKCNDNLCGFLKQKLMWREDILYHLKDQKVNLLDLVGIGYTHGLSIILFVSVLISIYFTDCKYFLYTFIIIYIISFLIYYKAFLKLYRDSYDKSYAKYFLIYLIFEVLLIRVALIPYLIYRLINPRKLISVSYRR